MQVPERLYVDRKDFLVMLRAIRPQLFTLAILEAPCASVTRLAFRPPITITLIRNMSATTLPKRTHAQTKADKVGQNDAKQGQDKENRDGGLIETTGDKRDAANCSQGWEDSVHREDGPNEYRKFLEAEAKAAAVETNHDAEDDASGRQGSDAEQSTAKKRGRGANVREGADKKQKKISNGNRGEPSGTGGDKTRVPEKGQKVQWSASPGTVNGVVVEVVYEEKTVEGQLVKGSKEDPLIVLKNETSGEVCVHKPDAVYFD
jgi:hypothetical protein